MADAGYTASGGVGTITFSAWGAAEGQTYRFSWRPESETYANTGYDVSGRYVASGYNNQPLEGTYVCNCQLIDLDTSQSHPLMGAQTVYVTAAPPVTTRPDDWVWQSTIKAGSPIQITAAEFRAFYTRIDDFREYKGKEKYDFNWDSIVKGAEIKADMINRAIAAIGQMNMTGLPAYVSSGEAITAKLFTDMAATLNAIE